MEIVTDMDDMMLDELSEIWDDIRENYDTSNNSAYDRTVLDCAADLAADPGGDSAYAWAIGLVMMAPYLTWLPSAGVAQQAVTALEAADRALRDRSCPHSSHPYESHEDAADEDLAGLLPALADETADWNEERPRDEWRCPRNAAGFARIALDIVHPGSATDIPPRLPLEAKDSISTLSALLNGYPKPWTDINDEISSQASELSSAAPADRAGRLMVVRAVTWYAVSGMVRAKSVLDHLVRAVEEALPHFTDPHCAHDGHPALPGSAPNAAELGILLSSAGGREIYERGRIASGRNAPIDAVVCPVLMADVADKTLAVLRKRRDELFGERDTSHADAEYLRADGRLDIGKLVERTDHKSWNEEYADDLGLWAARRHGESADDRDRTVLLLVAHQAMKISYPSPPLSVVRGVLATMRAVAAAPLPAECPHGDEHPVVRRAEFRAGMAHFWAPEEFPPDEDSRSAESWTCPRFAAAVAEETIRDLAGLYEEDELADAS
ncbi:hypothetical protein [Streptomyces sp. NBC_00338]|uniref:hypothetical protein n=1 Tax=Streptomyces sp. NBC_00338 TaxID=2975715 RepID=UPI002255D998|nr:hypothetical protein [Streptomyces sp. NBC_00338]MCX5143592.1 hypothetical protein [Streptomyces sp. NBC_00338]